MGENVAGLAAIGSSPLLGPIGLGLMALCFVYCICWSVVRRLRAPAALSAEELQHLKRELGGFFKRGRASLRIALVGTMMSAGLVLWGGAEAVSDRESLAPEFFRCLQAGHWLFLFYTCFFIAQWLVYFSSRDLGSAFPVRTLRSLLNEASGHWRAVTAEDVREMQAAYQTKATSSITAIAVLIATAAVVLSVCLQIIASTPPVFAPADPQAPFKTGVVYVSIACSLVSSLAFVVSVDALESVHNWFEDARIRSILLPHFYRVTINPKYVGFVLLTVSLIFLAAWVHPALGSLGFVALVSAGHSYWFPDFEQKAWRSVARSFALLAAAIAPLWLAFG